MKTFKVTFTSHALTHSRKDKSFCIYIIIVNLPLSASTITSSRYVSPLSDSVQVNPIPCPITPHSTRSQYNYTWGESVIFLNPRHFIMKLCSDLKYKDPSVSHSCHQCCLPIQNIIYAKKFISREGFLVTGGALYKNWTLAWSREQSLNLLTATSSQASSEWSFKTH